MSIASPGREDGVLWSPWATFAVALFAASLIVEVVRRYLRHHARSGRMPLLRAGVRRGTRPAFAVALLLAVKAALPEQAVGRGARDAVSHLVTCLAIAAVAWLLIAASGAFADGAVGRLSPALAASDNRRARRARTQLLVARRLFVMVVILISLSVALLTFPTVRAVGASLLAGAGIIAAILGVAGKSTLGNLVSGVQLAFTDLLRLDDVVVVGDEWGTVDEIGLTFVIIRTWDQRRLVMPSGYFTENPFQNWTRDSSRVIGTVFARLDYRVPVEAIRGEVHRVLASSPLWDQRDWVVQVTELNVDHVEIRALMSAKDAPTAWDLRCEVREALVLFIQREHPEAMPLSRVSLSVDESAPDRIPDSWGSALPRPRR